MSGTFERLADAPVHVEAYRLHGLHQVVVGGFERFTTVIELAGGGEVGRGEDVTYDAGDQHVFQQAGAVHDLAGRFTLRDLSARLGDIELFSQPPQLAFYRPYRRWAFESAALDLALRQVGRSLADALGRRAAPLSFAVSPRLGNPPRIDVVREMLAAYPGTRFKLDATSGWTDELVRELAGTGAVDVVDFKGAYHGTPVDQAPDPELYRRVATGLPDAWLEDPALTDATRDALAGHESRVTWDAPIHAVADIEGLAFAPRMLNIKPSRFGTLRALCDAYDHCAEQGIRTYGGGQFELGPGRAQIQVLAALFHPDAPNDVAPGAYNTIPLPPGLPRSPLSDVAPAVGFGRGDDGGEP